MTTLGWTCPTRAAPSCDMFNLGSSYFHVALTTVRHLLNAQSHVTAFRPISEAARSWSDDKNNLQISPHNLSDVAIVPWEIQKVTISTLLFIYFRLFMLAQTKTSSNCCTAALDVYLMLFSAFYYLHSPNTASEARYRRSACTDTDVLRLAAAACCDVGWISTQRGILRDWTVSTKTGSMYECRKWSV